jgi:aspartyl-tRNA(Asn)/glutamyl-tRNA(Gln) amidotransferase subunit A
LFAVTAKSICESADAAMQAKIAAAREALAASGVTVEIVDDSLLAMAGAAWNVLMSAELCNNVSRYDGIKYGYRTPSYKTIDELYTNSRTEAFGAFLKTVILFGSETLSTDNYMKVYDKALRVRRVLVEYFKSLFETVDAVLLPACSTSSYEESVNPELAFTENLYTAPASVTGLPAVVFGGVQLIGDTFSDKALLQLADLCEKEGR